MMTILAVAGVALFLIACVLILDAVIDGVVARMLRKGPYEN
jgi:hypothetical protein